MNSIPRSIHIDRYELLCKPNDFLDRNKLYCIYCQHGTTSKYVVSKLNELGFNTVNLIGGFANYLSKEKDI